jgi:hypothetical protein
MLQKRLESGVQSAYAGEAATHCTLGKAQGRRPTDTYLATLVLLELVFEFRDAP